MYWARAKFLLQNLGTSEFTKQIFINFSVSLPVKIRQDQDVKQHVGVH